MSSETANRPRAVDPVEGETPRRRLQVVIALLLGTAIVFGSRLGFIQIVQADHFRQLASDEHFRRTVVPPRRGDISDSTGHSLATSVIYRSLYVSTNAVADPRQEAARLAPVLNLSEESLFAFLSQKQIAPTLLKRWLTEDDVAAVQKLALDGLFFQTDPKRVYPQGALLDQVLGVSGFDDNGLSGLELTYNALLAGKPGSLVAERDSGGDPIALGPRLYEAPVDGASLVLTVDRYVQWVAERELTVAIGAKHATKGTVVVVEPQTGAVLALASWPTFHHDDPNVFSSRDVAMFDIPATSVAVEAGSTFRFVSMAAALETGSVSPSSSFFNSGSLTYAGRVIRDPALRTPGPMTMSQTLRLSSTVGLGWAATKVGAPKFYRIVDDFGFGQGTGIDLPTEASGFVRQPTEVDWDPFDLVNNSFGQGISASPLQIASAAATVANGGVRMKSFVVQRVIGAGADRTVSPSVQLRVIRGETAATLNRMLVDTVDNAGADSIKDAQVAGYAVAGLDGGPASASDAAANVAPFTDSFVGFGPAERPRFVIYVRLDGTTASAPGAPSVFGKIARQLMGYYQIPPSRPVAANGT